MVMKHYPAEFKADAVALYRSRPGATIAQVADDLGVNRETLRSWVRADDQRRSARPSTRSSDKFATRRPERRDTQPRCKTSWSSPRSCG
ncbi:transposase [Micromonospora sp. DR5-3]|nr:MULTISPECIES: transposase [unclassified Micromonospora]MCW3819408.1 transposase [Micromonospora sp. DR5-3]TYC20803.1 transposase [Micromonospora sp. MP36]